jgi:hypothetical protein
MRSVRRLLCAVVIAESWSKPYRHTYDFSVESIKPAMSWFILQRRGANILLTHGSLSPARRFATLTRFHNDSFIYVRPLSHGVFPILPSALPFPLGSSPFCPPRD